MHHQISFVLHALWRYCCPIKGNPSNTPWRCVELRPPKRFREQGHTPVSAKVAHPKKIPAHILPLFSLLVYWDQIADEVSHIYWILIWMWPVFFGGGGLPSPSSCLSLLITPFFPPKAPPIPATPIKVQAAGLEAGASPAIVSPQWVRGGWQAGSSQEPLWRRPKESERKEGG